MRRSFLWFLSSFVACFKASLEDVCVRTLPCPQEEDISPCVCTYYASAEAMDMDCSLVESEEELRNAFRAPFPVSYFRKFVIQHNRKLRKIENGVFGDVSFRQFFLFDNDLRTIDDEALVESRNTLESIEITMNQVSTDSFPYTADLSEYAVLLSLIVSLPTTPSAMLSEVPHYLSDTLAVLEFDAHNISEISAGVLAGLPGVTEFRVDSNPLTTISTGVFNSSINLTWIDLNNNRLETLKTGMFWLNDQNDNLASLQVRNNGLKTVEQNVFSGQFASTDLDVSINQLTTMDENVWRPIFEMMSFIYLHDNPLACGCDIEWLVNDPELLEKISVDVMCSNGTRVIYLNPEGFTNC